MSSSRQPSRRVSLGLSRAFLHSLARWTTQTSLHWHELGEDLHSRHAGVKLDALTMENTNTMKLLRRSAMNQSTVLRMRTRSSSLNKRCCGPVFHSPTCLRSLPLLAVILTNAGAWVRICVCISLYIARMQSQLNNYNRRPPLTSVNYRSFCRTEPQNVEQLCSS